jgi:hypothetical protein
VEALGDFSKAVGDYYGDLRVACKSTSAKLLVSVLLIGWLSWTVAVATICHPVQAIGFQFWLQHERVPRFYTWHQATAGLIEATVALVGISIVMLVATVLFYRNAQYMVKLWPVPAVLIGVVGSGAWWMDKGFFDSPGVLFGFSALALTVGCEAVCEHLGADFVFGKGIRPKREEAPSWG